MSVKDFTLDPDDRVKFAHEDFDAIVRASKASREGRLLFLQGYGWFELAQKPVEGEPVEVWAAGRRYVKDEKYSEVFSNIYRPVED